jgi:hypothetical protein
MRKENMITKEECDPKIRCPDCNKPMYALKGALSPIFVCSYCGTSLDEKSIQLNQKRIHDSNIDRSVPLLQNLFSGQFMKKYTDFDSFSEFINKCDLFYQSLDELSQETIAELPERKINRYVREHTHFKTWDQMFEKAIEWYLKM